MKTGDLVKYDGSWNFVWSFVGDAVEVPENAVFLYVSDSFDFSFTIGKAARIDYSSVLWNGCVVAASSGDLVCVHSLGEKS